MRFAVFTHVVHRYNEGKYFAYAPYLREMNVWFRSFNSEFRIQNSEFQVEVVAPIDQGQNISKGTSYKAPNIIFTQIPSFDLLSLRAVLSAIYKIPLISFKILKAMRRAEHLHLRCPGNIGFLASILQIFFPGKRK